MITFNVVSRKTKSIIEIESICNVLDLIVYKKYNNRARIWMQYFNNNFYSLLHTKLMIKENVYV